MTGQPRAKRDEATSLIVGVGMVAMLLVGTATVFGDAIAGVFAPPPPETRPMTVEPAAPGVAANTEKPVDAGGTKS